MKITRVANWYRPYYIEASGKTYRLEKIHFYKDGKVIASSLSGWLEKENYEDLETLELPVNEIKVKRKINLNGKEVYVISNGKEDFGNDLLAELYIPCDTVNLHFTGYVLSHKTQIWTTFKGDNDIYVANYVKSIDSELQRLRTAYEEVSKHCNSYDLLYNTEDVLVGLGKMKELAEAYHAEKVRIDNRTIEDYLDANGELI